MAKPYNKKRNTYFLFEALVNGFAAIQLDALGKNEDEFAEMSKKFFDDSVLGKDRTLYENILNLRGSGLSKEDAVYVVRTSKAQHDSLSEKDLFSQQSEVLTGLYESFGAGALSFEVDDYKLLANIKQYFDCKDLVESVRLEKAIFEDIDLAAAEIIAEEHRLLLDEKPLPEQEALVGLFESSNPGFRLFLNDEIRRIKPILREASICPECTECDLEMKGKAVQVLHMLEEFKTRPATRDDVRFFSKVQALAKELCEE